MPSDVNERFNLYPASIGSGVPPAVWKMIYLARRNPALAAPDFAQAWREHSALGRQCTNVGQRIKAVAQCARILDTQEWPELHTGYDGVNLMVLADRAAGTAIWSDPQTQSIMRPDEPRVFDGYVRDFSMLCREHVLHHTPGTPQWPVIGDVLLLGFLQKKPGWSGPMAAPREVPLAWRQGSLSRARRVVCNVIEDEPPAGYGYGCIVEWWMGSMQEAQTAAESAYVAATNRSDWGEHVLMLTQVTHCRA